jgi:hypothetical protein
MKLRTVTGENRVYSATDLFRDFDPRRLHAFLSLPALIYECCRT